MPSPEPWHIDEGAKLPPWLDRDDAEQVVALARLEAMAIGDDPDDAARDALRDFVSSERRRQNREGAATDRFREAGDPLQVRARLGWLADAQKVVGLSPARESTEGQKRRFLRNQMILACRLAGFSQRHVARAFELPHSRIAAIEREMRRKAGMG